MRKVSINITVTVCIIICWSMLLTACGNNPQKHVPLSDVVTKLLTEYNLDDCFIIEMAHYSTFEIRLENDAELDDETLEFVRDDILRTVYATTEFSLAMDEIEASGFDEETVTRYLMIGAIGYEKFGSETLEDDLPKENLLEKYNELESKVTQSFIIYD